MIEEAEQQCGEPLPASLRDWYSFEGIAPIDHSGPVVGLSTGYLWTDYEAGNDLALPLRSVLNDFLAVSVVPGLPRNAIRFTEDPWNGFYFYVQDRSEDPMVWDNAESIAPLEKSFSTLLFDLIAMVYLADESSLDAENESAESGSVFYDRRPKRHLSGLWLRSPSEESLPAPLLDYLKEHLREELSTEYGKGVVSHHFSFETARLKVTSDEYETNPNGVSAWWLSAENEADLEQLARILWPVGNLEKSLSGSTDVTSQMLNRLRN